MASFAILRPCIRGVRISRSHFAGSSKSLNSATNQETSLNKPISPWGSRPRLMLPPAVDGGAEVVGCSHGWVALFNKRDNDLFLSDPLSHRNIKLPPIHTLPNPEFNLDLDGHGSVSKLILSSTPDDDDCRAMMTFGPANRLAFCLPGRSSEWTPIGDLFFDTQHHVQFDSVSQVHEDLVYCTRRNVFTSITAGHLDLRRLTFDHFGNGSRRCDWDVQDPDSPKLVRSDELNRRHAYCENSSINWLDENRKFLENECIQIPHLVYAEESDQLVIAIQFVRLLEEEGGSPLGFVPSCKLKGLSGVFPGKTFGFIVLEVDEEEEEGEIRGRSMNDARDCCVLDDLNGRSMFVGINHSFAFDAGDDEEFKPNSIYFTDSKRLKKVCGVNDIGIFDYATKTISSPVVDCDGDDRTQSFKPLSSFWFV